MLAFLVSRKNVWSPLLVREKDLEMLIIFLNTDLQICLYTISIKGLNKNNSTKPFVIGCIYGVDPFALMVQSSHMDNTDYNP